MKRLVWVLVLFLAAGVLTISQQADSVQTARRLGLAYYEESKYREAAEQFRAVLREAGRNASFADHFNLGLALMSLPDEAGALAEFETARQMQPASPAVLYALAILNKREGRYQQSFDLFQQLEKTGEADMATFFNAGADLMSIGKSEEALAYFQKVLDRGYDFGPSLYLAAEFRISRLLQRMGKTDEAMKVYRDWQEQRKKLKDPNDSASTLELGPLAKPQVPPDSLKPRQEIAAPLFAERKEGAPAVNASPFPLVKFDSDVDGDLDELSIPKGCGNLLLRRNNGNGTFTDVTDLAGLVVPGGKPVCAIAAVDIDNDGDIDVIAAGPDGAWLFSNERGGKFSVSAPFGKAAATEVQTADLDGDGWFDVVFGSSQGVSVWWNRSKQLTAIQGAKAPFAVADLNGDGILDIAAAVQKPGPAPTGGGNMGAPVVNTDVGFWLNHGGGRFERRDGPRIGGVIEHFESAYDKDHAFWLEASTASGQHVAFIRTAPKARWLSFLFEGVRSNKEGVGSIVEVKSGNFYTRRQVGDQPLVVETGDLSRVDVVRVTWPNGIVQNVIDTETNKQLGISEQDRLASSCPLLYTWNGRQFEFFAEVLSSTPLGEPDGHGGQILPGLSESVFLPASRVQMKDGRYVFQLTEELREAIYMDSARLVALDHPKGTNALIDEAYRGAPAPSAPLTFERLAALNFEQRPAKPREDSLPGLMEKHAVYFDAPGDAEFLVLRGWTYWMDSNIAVAAAQDPKRAALPPRLEISQPDGSWSTVVDDLGMPAGAGRYVLADLRGRLKPATDARRRFRIVTNLRVNWERIFAAQGRGVPSAAEARPLLADLHFRGFSQPTISPTRSAPDFYDYSRLVKTAPWNPIPGRYTRYGDVRPLLASADDRLVVFGAGDELTLEFSPSAFPPLRAGWTRDFVLVLTGWAKAGETNTATSAQTDPMPYRAMKAYPYRSESMSGWQRTWLTRRSAPLLPPLAPAF